MDMNNFKINNWMFIALVGIFIVTVILIQTVNKNMTVDSESTSMPTQSAVQPSSAPQPSAPIPQVKDQYSAPATVNQQNQAKPVAKAEPDKGDVIYEEPIKDTILLQ